jgi:hypothetical protein
MSVKLVNLKVPGIPLIDAKLTAQRVTKTFFDVFGTTGCLLNCEAEKNLEDQFEYNKEKYDIKSKQDRKRVRAARAAHIKQHKGSRQDWFIASEIKASAARGCGSCSVLRQVIQNLFSEDEQLGDEPEYSVSRDFQLSRRVWGGETPDVVIQLFQYPGT